MVLQITEKFILRILHGRSGLRAPGLTGSGRLGFRSLVPTGCPYGEFTLADAWAETGKHLTSSSIQFNSIQLDGKDSGHGLGAGEGVTSYQGGER